MIDVVFFGTPQIAVPALEYLYNSPEFNVLAVVTQPDKPAGRGHKLTPPPVKKIAAAHNLPIFTPKSIRKEPEIQAVLRDLKPDFFVTFAFGQILSQEVLDIPKFATVNLHASLLPKYRGADPIRRVIMNGEKETGITTMITVLELDAGDICLCEKIPIHENMTSDELSKTISEKSPELIGKTLIGIYNGTLKPTPQCGECPCIASKISKEECEIDLTRPAHEIHNLVRGVCGSAYFIHNGKRINVLETSLAGCGIEFECGDGKIFLTKVKPEGKCEMSAQDWQRGIK